MSEGTRTPDRLDHNQELYQLSYAHHDADVRRSAKASNGLVGTPEADALLARHGAAGLELPVVIDGDAAIGGVTISRLARAWSFDRIGGAELARLAGRQAEQFGAELIHGRGVTGSAVEAGGGFRIDVHGDHEVRAHA